MGASFGTIEIRIFAVMSKHLDNDMYKSIVEAIQAAFCSERPVKLVKDTLSHENAIAFGENIMMLYPKDVRYYVPQIMLDILKHHESTVEMGRAEAFLRFLNGADSSSDVSKTAFTDKQGKAILLWLIFARELFLELPYCLEEIDNAIVYWRAAEQEASRGQPSSE